MEGREVQPRGRSDGHQRHSHPLGDGARPPGHDHRVGERERAQSCDRDPGGREGPPAPVADDRHVEGSRPLEVGPHRLPDHLQQGHAAENREQVAPALEHREQDDQRHRGQGGEPEREAALDRVGDVREPAGAQPRDLSEDRRVEPVGEASYCSRVVGQDRPEQQHAERDEPACARRADVLREGRRCSGRTATPPRAGRRRRSGQLRECDGRRFRLAGRDLVTDGHNSP